MNEEIYESEFYHHDFTTASEWEVFIARMEEIINQWKTDESQNEVLSETQGIWEIRCESLTFVDFEFNLFLYKKLSDDGDLSESSEENEQQIKHPIDMEYDFECYDEKNYANHSCISSWYGIDQYYVLSPMSNVGLNSESKIKMLLSSAYIVASNLNCERPIFIQIREKWQSCYLGVYENEGVRTNFEMVHLRKGPSNCQYLTGLLDLFKTKIISPCSIDSIIVSAQMTYHLTDFGNFLWKADVGNSEHFDVDMLPFGVPVDPINSLFLKASWSRLADNLIVDGECYSDFDPMAAPKWSCLVNMASDPVCLLGDALTEFFHNLTNHSTIYDILGDFASLSSADGNPLDLLTEPAVPTISTLLTRATRNSVSKTRKGNPPIPDHVLVPLLYFLFPDADESSSSPYGGKDDKEKSENSNRNVSTYLPT